jgi:hypothetical protein
MPLIISNINGLGGLDLKKTTNSDGLLTLSTSIPSYVTDGLLLYLDAGNGTSYGGSGTTWSDLSGNNRNATLVNTPTYDSSTNGGLFSFDDSQYEYATISDIGDKSVFSIEIWCRVHKSLTGKVTSVITNQYNLLSGANAKLNFSIGTNRAPTSYNLTFGYFDGSWQNVTGFAASLDTWYHLIGTYDGSTLKFYRNSILNSQLSYSGTPRSGGEIRIARRWDESVSNSINFFDGDISIIRIYNRALTQTEVIKNYNAQKSRYGL